MKKPKTIGDRQKAARVPTLFNMNYGIAFIPTDEGWERLRVYFEGIGTPLAIEELKKRADKDGYFSLQGWRLIECFGGLHMMTPMPFNMDVRIEPQGIVKATAYDKIVKKERTIYGPGPNNPPRI